MKVLMVVLFTSIVVSFLQYAVVHKFSQYVLLCINAVYAIVYKHSYKISINK